jgi:IclR family acetate operon transcriptional repressor
VGKVLLADRPADVADGVVRRTGLPARTPTTITDPAHFAAELTRVRARGWAVDDEEEETGVRCFAVPVRDGGQVIAAMSVSGPAARFEGVAIEPLVARMQEVADTFVTEGLRGGGPHPG